MGAVILQGEKKGSKEKHCNNDGQQRQAQELSAHAYDDEENDEAQARERIAEEIIMMKKRSKSKEARRRRRRRSMIKKQNKTKNKKNASSAIESKAKQSPSPWKAHKEVEQAECKMT